MIDLYTAFKLTDIGDNECIYLRCKSFPAGYDILTGREVKNKYDMRKTKVFRIFPQFCCGDFKWIGFDIVIGGAKH